MNGRFCHTPLCRVPLPLLFSPRASLLSGSLRDDRDRQILALRPQVLILRRQLAKRPLQRQLNS